MIDDAPPTLTLTPIGVVRSPFQERVEAPRQPGVAGTAEGEIVLFPGRNLEHAVEDLERWSRIWVVFWFHRNEGWRPKVLPPRSMGNRVGVLATRSPHRPNPIGLSALRLVAVRGLTLVVRDLDLLDGTPVLDVKPYVPYTDAHPDERSGWLEAEDPKPAWDVSWASEARDAAEWVRRNQGFDLPSAIERTLSLGPQPHAYRRIRPDGDGFRLAIKDWRARFAIEGRSVLVTRVFSGYRPAEIAKGGTPELALHQAFEERFGRG